MCVVGVGGWVLDSFNFDAQSETGNNRKKSISEVLGVVC